MEKLMSGKEVPNAPEGSWDIMDGGKHTHMSQHVNYVR